MKMEGRKNLSVSPSVEVMDFSVEDMTVKDVTSGHVFVWLLSIKDEFDRDVSEMEAQAKAKELGVTGGQFQKLFRAYKKKRKMFLDDETHYLNFSEMTEITENDFKCGMWIADDDGVRTKSDFGENWAVRHPVFPFERYVNIDTGAEKLNLAYRKGSGRWRTTIEDKRVLASASKITELAGIGIGVTSSNAKALVQYISDVETLSFDIMPEKKSVGRLGYFKNYGFSPYVDDLIFDGDNCFKPLFEAVTQKGEFEQWRKIAMECREMSLTAKIVLAASFASPLLEGLGCLPFFVHLWGVDSGTGKTVCLMLAASVWGDPTVGRYVKTFDSTTVGNEKTAAFLNHLPLCLDELQLARDSRGNTQFDVYKLAQGVGRTRGNKAGGVDITPTWKNTILTTGESPLNSTTAGAGAINRVIDIECSSGSPVIKEGNRVANNLKENFGQAGKIFVQKLYEDENMFAVVKSLFNAYFTTFSRTDTTEKQAMAAAAILVADRLACEWVFGGAAEPLAAQELSNFLASKESASLGARFYPIAVSWVAENKTHFETYNAPAQNGTYGRIEGNVAYISRPQFESLAQDNGVSPQAVLSWLRANNLILIQRQKYSYRMRVNGIPIQTIALKIDSVDLNAVESEVL
jgi:hypothetical protein